LAWTSAAPARRAHPPMTPPDRCRGRRLRLVSRQALVVACCAVIGGIAALTLPSPGPAWVEASNSAPVAPTSAAAALATRGLLGGVLATAVGSAHRGLAAALVGSTLTEEIEDKVKVEGGSIGDFKKTPSGLRTLDLAVGKGAECCAEGVGVVLDWSLRRSNGYFVDASYGIDPSRAMDEKFGVGLSQELRFVPRGAQKSTVIEGVREAVLGMREGGSRRISVPPSLGYTSDNLGPMPGDWGRKRQVERFKNREEHCSWQSGIGEPTRAASCQLHAAVQTLGIGLHTLPLQEFVLEIRVKRIGD